MADSSSGTIAMCINVCYPTHPRVENEAYGLIAAGFDVHLFCICHDKALPAFDDIRGLKVHRFIAPGYIHSLTALAYSTALYHRLILPHFQSFVDNVKPDVIHLHNMYLGRVVFPIARKIGVPVILDLHEDVPYIMPTYPHMQKIWARMLVRPGVWDRYQRQFIREADRVVVVTKEAALQAMEDQKDLPEEKFVVYPNTITPEIFLGHPIEEKILSRFKDTFNVLYVGDTGLRRGTDTLLEAVALLKDELPDLHCIIVGRSKEDAQLKVLAAKLGIHEQVSFEGWQNASLFPSYMKAAHIGTSPLKRNRHHDTTFANKVFQYMAMGIPSLVSDSTAQANLVKAENCGLIHEALNADDLADKILTLYNNKELRAELGANGYKSVMETYNTPVTIQALIDACTSLIAS